MLYVDLGLFREEMVEKKGTVDTASKKFGLFCSLMTADEVKKTDV